MLYHLQCFQLTINLHPMYLPLSKSFSSSFEDYNISKSFIVFSMRNSCKKWGTAYKGEDPCHGNDGACLIDLQ